MKIGFDNEKYLTMQSEHIRERIGKFGNKLYLEFGGKLFDDYHASRVLPGFEPDSKLRMLMQLSDQAEIVIVISAADIDKNKCAEIWASHTIWMYSALLTPLPNGAFMLAAYALPATPARKAQTASARDWKNWVSAFSFITAFPAIPAIRL